MQSITPFLWFDDQAEEAMNFYVSLFKHSKTGSIIRYGEGGRGPIGKVMSATFELDGYEFIALNGGPVFKITPSISFFVNCTSEEDIGGLWQKLSDGGTVMMELAQYPFSEKFGWVSDRFGVSWQLSLTRSTPRIAPFLMFSGEQFGKAEEAITLYTSAFENSRIMAINRYGNNQGGKEGTVMLARFQLRGQEFMAIDAAMEHAFNFTPAISLFVKCESQKEVDHFWDVLSNGGEQGQCGWLKDRYGVSWQIVPTVLGTMLQDKDHDKTKRVIEALLQMTKLDIATLQNAYDQH
ncbi:MAG TPA: VOC family protein [Bacteroidota bacterium]|nr:VOC family protein [Bacteroidota bacterium]